MPTQFELASQDQDLTIFDDEPRSAGTVTAATGDFNGDGRIDLAVLTLNGVSLLLDFPTARESTLRSQVLNRIVPMGFPERIEVADVNGDEVDDIVLIHRWRGTFGALFDGEIDIVLGRSVFPEVLDLSQTPPELRVMGAANSGLGAHYASGHFNGDSYEDMAIYSWSDNKIHVIFGRAVLNGVTINLGSISADMTVDGTGGVSKVAFVRANQDEKEDLVLSRQNSQPGGRVNSGEIDVIFGSTSLPSLWNLGVRQADQRLWGDSNQEVRLNGVGDLTGDGLEDWVIQISGGAMIWINGAALAAAGSVADMRPGQPGTIAYAPWGGPTGGTFFDFDGDGKMDAEGVWSSETGPIPAIYLTTESEADPVLSTPSIAVRNLANLSFLAAGDVNTDGKADCIFYGGLAQVPPAGVYYGAFYVFYGYEPLRNPTLASADRVNNTPRLPLKVGVNGPASEMLISGDIEDSFKEQWIPFQTDVTVTLTGTPGAKTITARFRNAFERESESVSKTLDFDVTGNGFVVRTNWVRNGEDAVVDGTASTPSRLQASLYTLDGRRVRRLMDGQVSGGFTFRWDGTNDAGMRVAPGIYVLVLNLNGDVTKTKVLVE